MNMQVKVALAMDKTAANLKTEASKNVISKMVGSSVGTAQKGLDHAYPRVGRAISNKVGKSMGRNAAKESRAKSRVAKWYRKGSTDLASSAKKARNS